MRKNLLKRMIDKDLSRKEIANGLGISDKSLYNKISGDTDFSLTEALFIHDTYFPGDSFHELFLLEP